MNTGDKVAEVVATCKQHGGTSIIALGGPPGTGKSHVALRAAQEFAGLPSRVKEIQFHQSYSYEEFIEGLRIASDGSVKPEKGVFLRVNEDAEADRVPGHHYVLLIEEFTRANLSYVLGEILTYVEHRERSFETMFSRSSVKVAPNLVIMATFNPTDRSAVNIDDALLRRMRIIDFPPDVDQLNDMLKGRPGIEPHVIEALAGVFIACEEKNKDLYDARMPFGHGIFAEIKNEADLHPLWHQRIRRILYRPGLDPHEFAETIQKAYPWHRSSGLTLPLPSPVSPPGGEEAPGPEAGMQPQEVARPRSVGAGSNVEAEK